MMRGITATIGLAASGLFAMLVASPAEAGCTRSIINKSALTALVARDDGPWVRIPPHSSQSIRLNEPGTMHYALVCGGAVPGEGPDPDRTIYKGSFVYQAIIDRCYIDFSDGYFTDYLGGGFFGFKDTKPLTLNNPRQGDVIIGPRLEEACPLVSTGYEIAPRPVEPVLVPAPVVRVAPSQRGLEPQPGFSPY